MYLKPVKNYFQRLGIKSDIILRKNGSGYVTQGQEIYGYLTGSKVLAQLFQTFGKYATGKIVPEWVLNAPIEFVSGFVDGFIQGDGHIHKRFGHSVSAESCSKSLLWGVKLLLARLGISAVVRAGKPQRPGKGKDYNPTWVLTYTINPNRSFCTKNEDYLGYFVNEVTSVSSSEQVFNLEVEEDESYLTTGGVAHNCSAFPKGTHDDSVDAMSGAIIYLRDSYYLDYEEDNSDDEDNVPKEVMGYW